LGHIAEAITRLAAEARHDLDPEWDGVGTELDCWKGKV
jgi:hypothetical protein